MMSFVGILEKSEQIVSSKYQNELMSAYWSLAHLHNELHYLAYTRKYATIALNIAQRLNNSQAVHQLKLMLEKLIWFLMIFLTMKIWDELRRGHHYCDNWSSSFRKKMMALWASSSFLAATSTLSCILGSFSSFSLRIDIFWAGMAAETARFSAWFLH